MSKEDGRRADALEVELAQASAEVKQLRLAKGPALFDEMMSAVLARAEAAEAERDRAKAEVGRLRSIVEASRRPCICRPNRGPDPYPPNPDCPVHGKVASRERRRAEEPEGGARPCPGNPGCCTRHNCRCGA